MGVKPIRKVVTNDDGTVGIPLTLGVTAIVDAEDGDLGCVNWHALKSKRTHYACRNVPRPGRGMLSLHRVIATRMGIAPGGAKVDHRDGNGLNCRRENLRAADEFQNAQNRRRPITNRSGYKGVSLMKATGMWHAHIDAKGTRYHLGFFVTREEAASAYEIAARSFHGEFAAVGR